MVDIHSDQPLARGFLPYHWIQGICEIRGGAANLLWYAVVKALGSAVLTSRDPDPLFAAHLLGLCMGARVWGLCQRVSAGHACSQTLCFWTSPAYPYALNIGASGRRPWLAMSGFVSVGYTPQTTDICVCCRHVNNVGLTRRQHSLKSAFFLPTCRGIVSLTHFPTCT